MTLWNPLNVFSVRTHPAADGPSASFDPSRTGDPLGPRPTDPAIGLGGTQIASPASTGDPRRHPIGFAPPTEQDAEPRFRTEISFRRHHELPRAGAIPVYPGDGAQPSWQSPTQVGPVDVDQVDPVGELPVPEESVPFFKREISFRRKKSAAGVEAVAAEATTDDAGDEPVNEVGTPDEMAEPADELVAPAADVAAVSAEPEHEDPSEDVVAAAEPESNVAEAVTSDADVEAVTEPVADAPVPFYKRELSFRRKKAEAEVVAVDQRELEAQADETHEVEELADAAAEVEPEVLAEVSAEVEKSDEPETIADEPVLAEVDAAVYELPEDDADAEAGEDLPAAGADAVPAAAAVVPIGFASSDDTTDHAWHTEDATHEPAPFEPEVVDDGTATDDVDVEDVEDADHAAFLPAAVAAVVATDADAVPDLPALADEDAPASSGRFGSRKRKSEKAPKRQGGKGRKVVGLKIGASQLAAAVVTETERGHELVGLARRSLAAGIVVDGEVRDEDALANAVRSFFDEEKLPKGDVRIGLSSNRIGVRTLDVEGVEDESRFDNAVRFKAHEVLPVALSESVLDYRVLEERLTEDGQKMRRVLLVVAPRDQVEPYTRVANLAGIRLEALDLEALGLLRAFVEPRIGAPTPDDTASVVVSIGHESSTLLVAGGGACEFTRVFDWGGSALEDSIASALDVRPVEAATILRHLSLSGPGRQYEALDEVTRAKATDAVRQRLTPFARELVNSLQFYQTQAESLGIGGIQITGGTSHLEGIDDALHQMIGVNVSVGNPLSRVIRAADFDPALEAAIGSLAVPIGLAIDDISMRGVNLLPKGAVVKKSRRSTFVAIGAPVAVAVPLAALTFLYLGAHGKVVDQQSQLDAAKAELAALPQPTTPTIDTAVVGDEAVRATAVANVLGGRLAWEAVFRDMSRVLPANVWLSTLSLTAPDTSANLADGTVPGSSAAAPGVEPVPTAVAIDGFTFTQPDVARLLARLATLPSLKRVTLTSSTSQLIGSKKVVHFVIVADLNQTGGAS
jgi:type IV pilus assembly protein PilM